MLWEMLVGTPPFGGTLDALIARVSKAPPEIPMELELPPQVRLLVTTCMQRRPDHRYSSVEDLLDALNECIHLMRPS
ncbi:MAG: hypothetical protein HC923_07885 [Myxococcales bacterium]|nr:hypothetical protein [Myxococcales bacterium]